MGTGLRSELRSRATTARGPSSPPLSQEEFLSLLHPQHPAHGLTCTSPQEQWARPARAA